MLAAKVLLLLLVTIVTVDAAKRNPPKGKAKAPAPPAKGKAAPAPAPTPGGKKKPGTGRNLDGEAANGTDKAPGAGAPEGFKFLGEGQDSRKYYISSEKKTRAEAMSLCRDFTKTSLLFANALVIGNEPGTHDSVKQLMSSQEDVTCAWTGNFFRTIDGQKQMFIPGVNDTMTSTAVASTTSRRKRESMYHRQTKRQVTNPEDGYGETYGFTLVQETHFPYFDNWDESKTGGCEPTCPSFNCTVTAPTCVTEVPECVQIESPSCHVLDAAPKGADACVADCNECNVTQPSCIVVQDPCVVKPRSCHVTAGNCSFITPKCEDFPRKCYTEQPPCEVKPPSEDSLCTAPACFNIPVKNIVHCRANKDRPECNTIPSVCLSPKFCAAPEITCPSPVTICLPPVVKCKPMHQKCEEPDIQCTLPEVYCPPPRVHCTQPVVRCQPPVVKCPREVIRCTPPRLSCEPPTTKCADPIVKCTPPPPCNFDAVLEREACPPPPTVVECKGEECVCAKLNKATQWGMEEGACSEQCNVVCEAT